MQQDASQLLDWYERSARSFLARNAPDEVSGFDQDARRLRSSLQGLGQNLDVCFLGNSGVGKSTLINAIVAGGHTVVPSGGVGPLTAQAISVRYSATPRMGIEYHGAGRLWQLVFGLESAWKSELGSPQVSSAVPEEFLAMEEEFDPELPAQDGSQERRDRKELAELMVLGLESRPVALAYVLDSLRSALGQERRWGTLPQDQDAARIERIRSVLSIAKSDKAFVREGSPEELRRDLEDHASGFLAPLIKKLTVWWPSPLLMDGITLIDLPGLGVVNDPRPEVTREFIRKRARAVILVVDNRGITEPVARLLRESEFLARLLHGSDDPASNPVLLVAVTKIDDIAATGLLSDDCRTYAMHFEEACGKTRNIVRAQLKGQLAEVWAANDSMNGAKESVVANLLRSLDVFPVSAPEYQKLLRGRRTDLDTPEQTNVPGLIARLRELKKQQESQHSGKVKSYHDSLADGLYSSIRLIEAEWRAGDRRMDEVEQLRKDLGFFVAPLQRQFDTLRGQYREFLRSTIPSRISDLVKTSRATARRRIEKDLAPLGIAHWATLKAAVRHGGRFQGKRDNIDLQRAFALRFEEPIAETWGTQILQDIRKRTREYADECVSLVSQVAEWARMQEARVRQDVVDAQLKQIKVDSARLNTVGKEMIKEVRQQNACRLIDAIDGPIRERCRRFVESAEASGPGLKDRILNLFQHLADEVTNEAEPHAVSILQSLFKEVEEEILNTLEGQRDPLLAICEAIAASQENYLARSDAQRRRKILAEVEAVLEAGHSLATLKAGA